MQIEREAHEKNSSVCYVTNKQARSTQARTLRRARMNRHIQGSRQTENTRINLSVHVGAHSAPETTPKSVKSKSAVSPPPHCCKQSG